MTDLPAALLDTSTVILLERVDPEVLPEFVAISSITLAELAIGPLLASTEAVRTTRYAHLRQAEEQFEVIPFDARAARAFALVATSLRSVGRKPASRGFDALIAATAVANQLPLYTCNPDDFTAIEGVDVRAVRHPDH